MEIFNQISERVEEFIVTFLTNDIWRIMLAVVVMVIVVLLKSFISRCVFKLIERSMTDKGRVGSFVDDLIKIVDRPLRLVIISAGIHICHLVLRMPDGVRTLVEKTVSSLLLFAVFWALFNSSEHLKGVLTRVTEKSEAHLDNIAVNYLVYALKALVIIFGGLSILQIWVGNISSLIAGLSIGGVAFALAAQDTAANLFGSITVMLDHPFEIGEYIEIDGIAGTVERMGLRSTRIRTADQSLVIVPNKTMSSVNITNWTKIDRRRVMFTIGVTYSTTSEQLRELVDRIRKMLEARDDIRQEGLLVDFSDFGASSLDIMVRFYTLTGAYADAVESRARVNFAIMDIVNEMGLSFAFPSQSVYIESLPEPPCEMPAQGGKS